MGVIPTIVSSNGHYKGFLIFMARPACTYLIKSASSRFEHLALQRIKNYSCTEDRSGWAQVIPHTPTIRKNLDCEIQTTPCCPVKPPDTSTRGTNESWDLDRTEVSPLHGRFSSSLTLHRSGMRLNRKHSMTTVLQHVLP